MESAPSIGLQGVILGASGAIGRELLKELCASSRWSQVSVIVRRELEDWKTMEGSNKIQVIQVDSLDQLEETQNWEFKGATNFFCCLGSRTQEGKELFYQVDFSYCLWGALIAKSCGIPHYSLVSSQGADATSMFYYMKTQGQIENAIRDVKLPFYSIFRPALLTNRDNDDRIGEQVLSWIPFLPKIEASQVAKALRVEAEQTFDQQESLKSPYHITYTNTEIKGLIENKKCFLKK